MTLEINMTKNKMNINEHKIVARFPNGLLQIDVEDFVPTSKGNKYSIVDKDFNPIVDAYFSGVVYLNKIKFEVYQDHSSRIGILEIDKEINWEVKTPNEIRKEAITTFRQAIIKEFEKMSPDCICQYPRVLDYFEHRNSTDSNIIMQEVIKKFLTKTDVTFDKDASEHLTFFNCKNCGSQFKHRYRERGIDKLTLVKIVSKEVKGQEPKELAPNYLDALFAELFYKKSFIFRENLFKAGLGEMEEYLFKMKK